MSTTAAEMNLKTFLNLCAGNWFTQRTTYDLVGNETESNKADLNITLISAEDSRVTQLCQQYRIDPQNTLGGLFYSWDTSVDWGKPKKQGNSLMVFVPDSEDNATGKLITSTMPKSGKVSGTYVLGEDEALTLTINAEDTIADERLWFASENLKLRSTVIKNATGSTHTAFYSEIRKAPPKTESAE